MSFLAESADLADAHTEQPILAGRRALVTGGTTGIGRAIAVLLASEGAKVFICGRDPRHLEDALERIREVGDGEGIAIDLAERESAARLSDDRPDVTRRLPHIDGQVAKAEGGDGFHCLVP